MAEFTEGERWVRDATVGGLVRVGLFPFVVEVEAGRIAKFTNKSDAILDAAAPKMYEALKDLTHDFTTLAGLYGLSPDYVAVVLTRSKKALALAEGKEVKES